MSKIEIDRAILSSDPRFNQGTLKRMKESQRLWYGNPKSKEGKSAERRAQGAEDEKFALDWINRQSELNLDPKSRFELALRRGNDEDVQFLFSHLDDMSRVGYQIDTSTLPAKEEIKKSVGIVKDVDKKIA